MPPATAPLLALALLAPPPPAAEAKVETRFVQVAPPAKAGAPPQRSPGQARAVVLLHGFRPHPFVDANALHPDLSSWEEPNSAMVKALGRDADVYALGYAQFRPVDEVARAPALARYVEGLRAAGYTDIVLIGYSAGALVARYYVEDRGDRCGVTKVIQVCPPNGGTAWGKLTAGVRQSQEPFLASLTKEARQTAQRERAGRLIPAGVEFVCVVGAFGRAGDGLVRYDCQWTRDLQLQGVPAVLLHTPHVTAMRSKSVAQRLADLAREPQPRWGAAQVEAARAKILGRDN
jgi:triacylglycerol esterase/lipase EstA (alpha/beta hydrolase family)